MKKLNELLNKSQSVALNTKSEDGHPFSSYASFYYDGELIYVSIPSIALHIQNIEYSPKALVLFVEDAVSSKSVLERHKTTLECNAKSIDKNDVRFKEIMPKFENGALGILIGMQELTLYVLTPTSGEVTFGFGETYSVGGEKMNEIEGW